MNNIPNTIKEYVDKNITLDCYDGDMLLLDNVLKKLNISLYETEFEDSNASGELELKNELFSIYVNRSHPFTRQRFTVAHELGHYISYVCNSFSKEKIEKNGGFEDYIFYNRKNGNYKSEDLKAEHEANQIAAEILMPEHRVKEMAEKNTLPEEMAKKFNVSASAMAIRLKSLYAETEIY